MEKEHIDFYNSLNETLSGDGIQDNAKHNLFESAEEDSQEKNESRKSRPSKSARLEQEKIQLLNELNEQKRLLNELKKASLEKDESTLELVNTNIKFAKMTAEAENDLKAKTEAEDALMELKLKKYQIQKEKEELNRYVSEQQTAQYVNSEADANYREFLERNPFINHFDQTNPNFSQGAYNLAQKLSSKLSMQYKRQGRGDEEFSPAYFEDLENMINSEIEGGDSPMEHNTRRNSFSAPVNNYQSRHKQKNLTMSAEEQKTFEGFMNHALNDKHKEFIRKRFLNAKKQNYESANIYKI